ncbi:MAG: hypothetical protein A3A82_01735 [Candidatus Pacebacteria bacterium RIFCSPLOWO2_01_FULL_47_12]|nr:MAG: hypothetical protein A3J60_04225 [Candidatus Pacebacteria bacterium RIFCSPHIGHO2_02_FULL_46_9]OGJ39411.1 MAG: hypothetical protein A3A82_01735 [Candidatus Pacebacteria bacterium RIFCSPLOWO2_01_FULL_47_12]
MVTTEQTENQDTASWQELRPPNYNNPYPEAQVELLKREMEKLQLTRKPKVNSEIIHVPTEAFLGKHILALIGLDEATVALLLASEPRHSIRHHNVDILPVIPVIGSHGPSLLSGPHGDLYTDCFWQMYDGEIRLIKPSMPVFVARVFTMYDTLEELAQFPNLLDTNRKLFAVTEHKWSTKQILLSAGVATPKGILYTTQDNLEQVLGQALTEIPEEKDIVIKGNTGSGGKYVRIFRHEDVGAMRQYVQLLLSQGQDKILFEERVRSVEVPISRSYRTTIEAEAADYNVRVLVTLDRARAIPFDSEVRYGRHGYGPINVSAGAEAVRTEKVLSQTQIATVNAAASAAVEVLCQTIPYQQGQLPMLGFAGVDIILDRNNVAWVIEVNSGAVGGIGTLTKLDHKPPQSLQKFLNTCRYGLQRSGELAMRRGVNQSQDVKDLERLKLDSKAQKIRVLLEVLEGLRRFTLFGLIKLLEGESGFKTQQERDYYLDMLAWSLEKNNRTELHEELLNCLFALDPSEYHISSLGHLLAKKGGRKGARAAIERFFVGTEYDQLTAGLKTHLATLHLLAGDIEEYQRMSHELLSGELEINHSMAEYVSTNLYAWKVLSDQGRKPEALIYLTKAIPGLFLILAKDIFKQMRSGSPNNKPIAQ